MMSGTTVAARSFADLSHLLATQAVAPIHAQAVLDAEWDEDSRRWREIVEPLVAQCPVEWSSALKALLAPTAPARHVVQHFELDCFVQVQLDRERGFGLRVRPLELGWQKIATQSQAHASRIALTIECVPLPAAPSATAGLSLDADTPLLPG
jgi:hypothetical protein